MSHIEILVVSSTQGPKDFNRKDSMKNLNFLLIGTALIFSAVCQAQGGTGPRLMTEEEHFEKAKQDTVDLLNDRRQREKAVRETEDSKKAGARVKELSGGDAKTEDEYYKLSSDIMKNFKDEKSMREVIENAQKDPMNFHKHLTPEQLEKIKELSGKVNPASAAPANP